MKAKLIAVALLLAAIAFTSEAFAQGMGRGPNFDRQRLYDVDTVETMEGEVTEIEYFGPKQGMGQGVHLKLKTDDETLAVHLGPRWFMDKQDVQIDEGDLIKVKGSLITFDEEPTIIAAEIEKGDETLRLRDEKGFPVWAGWRRGNR